MRIITYDGQFMSKICLYSSLENSFNIAIRFLFVLTQCPYDVSVFLSSLPESWKRTKGENINVICDRTLNSGIKHARELIIK